MSLTFRDTKGSPLTSAEADANIRQLAAGGINYAASVAVNSTAEFPAAVANTLFEFGGSGFSVNLPAAASQVGTVFEIRIKDTATGLYTLVAVAGETLNGETIRSLWAQETVRLFATALGWCKLSGKSRPMFVEAWLSATFNFGQGGPSPIPFNNVKNNKSTGMSNGYGFKIPRRGLWNFTARMGANGLGSGNQILILPLLNGTFNNDVSSSFIGAANGTTGTANILIAFTFDLAAGNEIVLGTYSNTGGGVLGFDGQPQDTSRIAIAEICDW